MRIVLLFASFFFVVGVKSQSTLPAGNVDYLQSANRMDNTSVHDSIAPHKWFFSTYQGLSTSVLFFKGGSASVVAMPLELQLNRRLNNNFYAFAGIGVTPSYINFNRAFINENLNKAYSDNMLSPYGFDMHPSVSLGLMYINDARTFSISGSISAERTSGYPLMPYYPANNAGKMPVNLKRDN
ncbi:MAG: hypothetical protein ABIY62_03950 [Ginsengibacter sp.]